MSNSNTLNITIFTKAEEEVIVPQCLQHATAVDAGERYRKYVVNCGTATKADVEAAMRLYGADWEISVWWVDGSNSTESYGSRHVSVAGLAWLLAKFGSVAFNDAEEALAATQVVANC